MAGLILLATGTATIYNTATDERPRTPFNLGVSTTGKGAKLPFLSDDGDGDGVWLVLRGLVAALAT